MIRMYTAGSDAKPLLFFVELRISSHENKKTPLAYTVSQGRFFI